MPVPNFEITDLKTFKKTTEEPHQIAGLYFYYKLDCLVELAYQIALDFYRRPELFTDLSSKNPLGADDIPASFTKNLAPLLSQLNARNGSQEKYLDHTQRHAIYVPLFGNSSDIPIGENEYENSNFRILSAELMDACAIFSETHTPASDNLLDGVRQAQSNFQQYLTAVHGDSVRWSYFALSYLTEQIAYPIFRNQGISGRYGIQASPGETSPYKPESNLGKLVASASKAIGWPLNSKGMYGSLNNDKYLMPYISFELFTNEQQVAIKGTRAIATAIEVDPTNATDKEIETLIKRVYTWGKAEQKVRDFSKKYVHHHDNISPGRTRGEVAIAQPMMAAKEIT